jgi:hypothetical protein
MDLQTKGLSENFLKSKGIKFRAMELLKISWQGQEWLTR